MFARASMVLCILVALTTISRPSDAQVRAVSPVTKVVPVSVPQGLTVTHDAAGNVLRWQGSAGAVSYRVTRVPADGGPTVNATVWTSPHFDRGFVGSATYQVFAVTADGRTSAGATVTYTGPPVFSSFGDRSAGPDTVLTLGDTIVVHGSWLSGASLAYNEGRMNCGGEPCRCTSSRFCHYDPSVLSPLTPLPAPFAISPSSVSFVLPRTAARGNNYPSHSILPGFFYLVVKTPGGSVVSAPVQFQNP
jgi:hypothetical protein